MDMMALRRSVIAAQPKIPHTYRQVKWLSRTSTDPGPVSQLNFPVGVGYTIITKTKPENLSGERAFGCTNQVLELYYQNNTGALTAWSGTSGLRTIKSREYGDEMDTLVITINIAFTFQYWGYYRATNYLYNGKMFGLTILDADSNPVLDLVPCVRRADNEPGWYDTVGGGFYPNISTYSGSWGIGPYV